MYHKLKRSVELSGKNQSTLTNCARCLAHISLHFKCSPLDLDEEQILDYLHVLKSQHKTPSDSFFKHTVYGIRYAYRMSGMKEMRVILPSIERSKKLPVVLSRSEVRQLLRSPKLLKHRWQIETMFKRLKQNFPLKYFLGDRPNAIKIQIWCGLIIQLLMLVVQKRTRRIWAYFNMISMVRLHLMSYIDLFSFLENSTQKWNQLTTKPPDIQLSFF